MVMNYLIWDIHTNGVLHLAMYGASSVRFLKLRVLMKLSWRYVITLRRPDLALSNTELVALKRVKSLEIVLGTTSNVTGTFLQDKPEYNIPRVLFLSLLLRDRLLPISYDDSKSILNRQLDVLIKVSSKPNTPTGNVCYISVVFCDTDIWRFFFLIEGIIASRVRKPEMDQIQIIFWTNSENHNIYV